MSRAVLRRVALVGVLALAGCGDDDASPIGAAGSSWAQRASTICERAREVSVTLAERSARDAGGDVEQETRALARQARRVDADRLRALRRLPRPDADAAAIAARLSQSGSRQPGAGGRSSATSGPQEPCS